MLQKSENLSPSLEKMKLVTPPRKGKVGKAKSHPGPTLFGLNKGVKHSIKKPKPAKQSARKSLNKSGTEGSSGEDEVSFKTTPKTFKANTPKLIDLIQPSAGGNITVAKDKNVSYDIKNGQMTFR